VIWKRVRAHLPLAILLCLAVTTAGCGTVSQAAGTKTITFAFQDFGGPVFMTWATGLQKKFEKLNPGVTVKLDPIQAPENDYYTKLELMQRSSSTAPDVLYEDTFLTKSDVAAGYLMPLDNRLKQWPDWSKEFFPQSKIPAEGPDGKVYGVPMGTDTRALWYNKTIFKKAGIAVPWHPKTWNDVLAAARKIKAKVPGVIPYNLYSGTPAGEASTMQGFEMLLYGTHDTLFNPQTKKWIAPSKGLLDALTFLNTLFREKLVTSPSDALNANITNIVPQQWMPAGKVAIDQDGSWLPTNWIKGGGAPWPAWSKTLGVAAMPTAYGQKPDVTSLSGGWTLSISQRSRNPDLAWKFVKFALNKQNSLTYDIAASQIAVRKDVASSPQYLKLNPTIKTFTSLVKYTQYRPAYSVYPQVSNEIQVIMGDVMLGQMSPASAMSQYTAYLKHIEGIGDAGVQRSNR
jgi:multiple sugar transport system substrate-binding protein